MLSPTARGRPARWDLQALRYQLGRNWIQLRPRTRWAAEPVVPARRASLVVFAIAATGALFALVAVVNADLELAYADARSRLTIARSVLDNQQPGLAQLGNVWLPLHMLAMMPTVWIDWMYRSGASGIGLSLTVLVATAFYAHRYVYVLTRSHAGGLVAVATVLLSLNFLFLGVSPMSEVPFAALSVAGWYYLVLWAKAGRQQDLAKAALLIAGSTMIRYDGWFSLVTGALFIVLANPARRGREGSEWTLRAEAELTAFGAIAVFPMFLWVFYNAIIFGHPFAFATGSGSAADYAREFATTTGFSVQGDVVDSVRLFGWAVLDNVGGLVAVAALVGFVVAAAVFRNSVYAVALLLPASVIAFNVVSLYVGGSVLLNQRLTPELGSLNIRYGVMAVPFVAILVGTLASFGRALMIVVLIVIAAQTVIFARGDPVATVHEVRQGDFGLFARTAKVFNETYDRGLVLIAFRSHADMLPSWSRRSSRRSSDRRGTCATSSCARTAPRASPRCWGRPRSATSTWWPARGRTASTASSRRPSSANAPCARPRTQRAARRPSPAPLLAPAHLEAEVELPPQHPNHRQPHQQPDADIRERRAVLEPVDQRVEEAWAEVFDREIEHGGDASRDRGSTLHKRRALGMSDQQHAVRTLFGVVGHAQQHPHLALPAGCDHHPPGLECEPRGICGEPLLIANHGHPHEEGAGDVAVVHHRQRRHARLPAERDRLEHFDAGGGDRGLRVGGDRRRAAEQRHRAEDGDEPAPGTAVERTLPRPTRDRAHPI